jgi:hypothetical protein
MNSTVQASLDAQLAELAERGRLVPQPGAELGYGSDLSCVSDLTEDLAEVDPLSLRAIGEAAIRRLTTPRGSLPDDRDYGLDVRRYCNRATGAPELRELAGRCALELAKDDRIDSATVTATQDPLSYSLTLSVVISPASPTLNPFTLTFAVTSGSAVLEALG